MSLVENDNFSTPWVADLRYQILDLPVRVLCSDASVANRLSGLLGPFSTRGPVQVPSTNTFSLAESESAGTRLLTRNGDVLARSNDWAHLIAVLVAELNSSAVAEMSCFVAHAGAVAGSDGVVAFPSESGGGKSTLTAACLLVGFQYVSDEALCLDYEDGKVLPYPKPMSLSARSIEALHLVPLSEPHTETLLSPRDLGAVVVRRMMPLRHVLLMEHGEGDPELHELSRSEVVSSLLRASFNHYKRPEESFKLIVNLAPSCQAWRFRFNDPLEGARMLQDRLYG